MRDVALVGPVFHLRSKLIDSVMRIPLEFSRS